MEGGLTEPLKRAIFLLYSNGMPQKNIALELGVKFWFVSRAVKWCKSRECKKVQTIRVANK